MAWNKSEKKSLQTAVEEKAIPYGAPVSVNMGFKGRPYSDGWDISRAYSQGIQRVTWVHRAIDTIASNHAKLPIFLRKGDREGEIFKGQNDVLTLLNGKTNAGENSFMFKHRISSQLLISTRGVFIEKITNKRTGEIQALNLLPPEYTAPIPDPRKFVSGFSVIMPGMQEIIVPADDVIWIRKPHPLNPYLSLTPMEAAGVAIEIENLAKLYNRNFMLNDGRPGSILVLKGEMDPEDREEINSRFRPGIAKSGQMQILAADGAQLLDTGATPRDAAYVEMRDLTKEEILAAFGVPESAIGNASGRTFSNASEELRVFWIETMLPHLELIGRSLDELDPRFFVDYDTSKVPILILIDQEKKDGLAREFKEGLITQNEYREGTGRQTVVSEYADSLMINPNLVPVANTEMPFDETQFAKQMAGGQEGQPGAPTAPATAPAAIDPATQPQAQFEPVIEASAWTDEIMEKAYGSVELWEGLLETALTESVKEFEEKWLSQSKAGTGRIPKMPDDFASILDKKVKPVLKSVMIDGIEEKDLSPEIISIVDELSDKQASNLVPLVVGLEAVAAKQMTGNDTYENRSNAIKAAVAGLFTAEAIKKLSSENTVWAKNGGIYSSSLFADSLQKTWVSKSDPSVRSAHRQLHGKTVSIGESFVEKNLPAIRFPGDPFAPPEMTVNCRCRLRVTKR